MAIFTSKILKSPLFPTFFVYRFLGMGIIEFPVGRRRWIPSLLYSLTICIFYLIVLLLSHDMLATISEKLSSSIASFAFRIFTSLNCLMIIANLISVMFRNEKHHHCVIKLLEIDAAIQEMGASRSYQRSLKQRMCQLLGSLFIGFVLNIWDYFYTVQTHEDSGMYSDILSLYLFDYPVLLSIFGDITFCVFNRAMTYSLEDLNSLLKSMGGNYSDGYETRIGNLIRVEAILKDKNKLEKLRCIRKIYSRLVKLAKHWSELNGMHVVSSTVFAIWLGTYGIYSLWDTYFNPDLESEDTSDYAYSLKTIICHVVKLYLIVWSSTALTVKAQQTYRILLTYLQPIAFLRSEVDEFALQLIQNPLRLSAAGLFDLNYTLMHMVIANVATYLVVLIQTDLSIGTSHSLVHPHNFQLVTSEIDSVTSEDCEGAQSAVTI